MGKTYRNNSDDAEYYKAQKLQREQQQRRKKQRGRESYSCEERPEYEYSDNSRRK
jgi:hypothetical protein